jgi:hypothetical protein
MLYFSAKCKFSDILCGKPVKMRLQILLCGPIFEIGLTRKLRLKTYSLRFYIILTLCIVSVMQFLHASTGLYRTWQSNNVTTPTCMLDIPGSNIHQETVCPGLLHANTVTGPQNCPPPLHLHSSQICNNERSW